MGDGKQLMSCLKISMKDNFSAHMMKKLRQTGPRAAHAVAVQVEKDMEPFVPARTKSLLGHLQGYCTTGSS